MSRPRDLASDVVTNRFMPREFVLNRPGFFVHDALSHNEYITPDTLNTPRRLKQKVAALAPFCHDELLLGSNYEPIAGKSKRSTEFILRGSRPCNRALSPSPRFVDL